MKRANDRNLALRIALLAGSNLDLLEKPLTSRLLEKEFAATIWNPGFNQYRQAILDPSSGLYQEKADAILFVSGRGRSVCRLSCESL
jgi:predicted enzyme involved in methoxymalonyl-ACP biosynthesis